MTDSPQEPTNETTRPEGAAAGAAAPPADPTPEAAGADGADEATDEAGEETAAGEGGDAAADEAGEATVESLVADLERVTAERDQLLDGYRRALADLENYKKQSQRRLEDEVNRRVGSFMEGFLPVLDACDAAAQHGAGDEVAPIVNALLGVLEKAGMQRLDPSGQPFDPNVAEAVVHEPGEGGEQVVAEVLRAGYAYQGRVLRPAMVKVTD